MTEIDSMVRELTALRHIANLADEVRCEFEMERGPSYDLLTPLTGAVGRLTLALAVLCMTKEANTDSV